MNEEQRAENALRRHEAAKAQLYRSDGAPKYSEEEMRDQMRGLEERFHNEIDSLGDALENRIASARAEISNLENADPTDDLTTAELTRANAKRQFVADDVYALPLDKLEERCRAALAEGARVNMFLLSHFVGQRLGEEDPESDPPGAHELRELVNQLRHKLEPERASKLARAGESIAEAEKAQFEVSLRRGGHRSAVEGWREADRANWVG